MMVNKKKQLQLATLMGLITIGITSLILLHLYHVDLDQQKKRLLEAVVLDANLIDAVATYDIEQHHQLQLEGSALEATLSQVRDALGRKNLLSLSEHFYLVKKQDEKIIISASSYTNPAQIPPLSSGSPLAKLLTQAIDSKNGTLIDYDQYGNRVIAAYAYIPAMQHTLIAKIDIAELQEPFIFAAVISFVIATAIIIFSSYRFLNYNAALTHQLEEKEEKLRLLLESSGEAIYCIDLEGNCTFANPACARLLGYQTVEELIGQHMHRLIHHSYENGERYPEDKCHIYQSFIKSEKCHIDNEVFWTKSGTALPIDYCSSPIKRSGDLVGAVISFTDASEKRQHERALKESEKRYRSIFEDAFVGIAHVSLEGEFIDINHRLSEIVGYSKDELKALTFMDVTHPDDLDKDLNHIQQLLAGNTDSYAMEKRYFHKDGSIVWIDLMVKLLRDFEGKPQNFISVINDITLRKQSDKSLKKAQEAHSQAEQITHFGNWDWDIESGELQWTDEIYRIFGVEPQQFPATYQAFLDRIYPDDRDSVIEAVNNAVSDPSTNYNIEHRIIRPTSEERYVQEQGRVYRNKEGKPIRMIGTVHDITDRKLAEIELQRYKSKLEKLVDHRTQVLVDTQTELVKRERLAALGQITATVSHELRNPLSSIRSSLYVVEKLNSSPDPKLNNALQRVVRNVERCDHIIDELLDFTRSTTLYITSTPLHSWLKELLDEQQLPDDIEIDISFSSDDCTVDVDQEKFQRVIINIVENACQAMLEEPEKPHKLKIETTSTDNQVCTIITDNGPGISDENQQRIFEPLFSTKGFGTGLGLPTVKKIIEQHNGKISINSKIGIGTCIIISMPKYQVDDAIAI